MHRRSTTQAVADNIRAAIDAAGTTAPIVARATDMPVSDLELRLEGAADFRFSEVVRVGGFLRVPTSELLKEVAA